MTTPAVDSARLSPSLIRDSAEPLRGAPGIEVKNALALMSEQAVNLGQLGLAAALTLIGRDYDANACDAEVAVMRIELLADELDAEQAQNVEGRAHYALVRVVDGETYLLIWDGVGDHGQVTRGGVGLCDVFTVGSDADHATTLDGFDASARAYLAVIGVDPYPTPDLGDGS